MVTLEDPKPQEAAVTEEERAASKAPEEERAAAKVPEQSALQRAAAVGEFAADSSLRQRFERILTSIRSLHFIGFQGTEGIGAPGQLDRNVSGRQEAKAYRTA